MRLTEADGWGGLVLAVLAEFVFPLVVCVAVGSVGLLAVEALT